MEGNDATQSVTISVLHDAQGKYTIYSKRLCYTNDCGSSRLAGTGAGGLRTGDVVAKYREIDAN